MTVPMPKSSTFACGTAPVSVTITLSGLRSRWTMPAACAQSSASSTSAMRRPVSDAVSAPWRRMRLVSVSPGTYSKTP
ncbi:Uncharacterised protein [Mycobacterium tuberculosis]|nr:Uncharacterised protein [Mycobacterium tuberculosis]